MPLEDEPPVGLLGHDGRELHAAAQDDHRQDGQGNGQLIADHLRAASHGANQGKLVVGRPTGQQDTQHSDGRNGQQEKDTDVEIQHLESASERQVAESQHRGHDNDKGCQNEQEAVGAVDEDQFLDEHLDHVGHTLDRSLRSYPVRPDTALELSAHAALHVNQDQGDHRVQQQNGRADQDKFDGQRRPRRHRSAQRFVYPTSDY